MDESILTLKYWWLLAKLRVFGIWLAFFGREHKNLRPQSFLFIKYPLQFYFHFQTSFLISKWCVCRKFFNPYSNRWARREGVFVAIYGVFIKDGHLKEMGHNWRNYCNDIVCEKLCWLQMKKQFQTIKTISKHFNNYFANKTDTLKIAKVPKYLYKLQVILS